MIFSNEILEQKCAALIKTTLVDFPGRVACTVFLTGCNLRCPYCYNHVIVNKQIDSSFVCANEIIAHLEKRKKVLTGFVISGGEPLLNPFTPFLIKKAKALGYKIKLDTNGTLPDLLKDLISDDLTKPDFIAVDIKTNPKRYLELIDQPSCKTIDYEPKIKETIKIVSNYNSENREFRTVLVPTLVKADDIKSIAEILPKDASWQFAQFRNENCLNPAYNKIPPYTDSELNELINLAKKTISGANLR